MTTRSPAPGGPPVARATGHFAGADSVPLDLSGVLDTVDLPLLVVDRNGTVVRINQAATSVLGVTPEDLGRSLSQVRILSSVKDLESLCLQGIADEAPCRRDIREGERWFVLRIAPFRGSDHQIRGAVLTFTNVTAFRASIEQAIYEREHTKAILNTVVQPLVVVDAALRVQTANRAFYLMFQVAREEVQGIPLDALRNHAWNPPHLWAQLKETLSSPNEFETREIECDFPGLGRRVLLLDARPLSRKDASGGLMLLAFQDISKQKQSEAALRESEKRYRTLFASMDEGFCTIEVLFDEHQSAVDYRFLDVNDAFERQTGIQGAKGQLMRDIAPLHEQHWFDIYGQVARTGVPVRFENFAQALNRWYDVYAFQVGPPEHRHVAVLFNDITVRRRIEEELRESDRRKDEFLATLAHELRGPLAPLRNMLEILQRADGRIDLIEKAHSTMDRQLSQMTRLIDDLLDVSRIREGRIELKRERTPLASAVAQAVEACQPLADRAHHDLRITLPPEPIDLYADPVRLAQILGNLLHNACKYTEDGGRIGLSVDLEEDGSSPTAVITVRDSGMGIAPDKLESIFGLFTQMDRTLERAQGGLGIGLMLVKRLVEMHGGSVEAFSEGIGQGSEFVVRLPVLRDPSREPHPPEPGAPPQSLLPALRILIVDDNRDGAGSLALLLKLAGHETHVAHDGLEAVQAAARLRPDVVLLDIGLPQLNGRDAARRIREQPSGAHAVLVALSGWGQDEDRRQSLLAGFDAHFVKPLDYGALLTLLNARAASRGTHREG